MKRHTAEFETDATASATGDPAPPVADPAGAARALAGDVATYGQDLEDRYVDAREAWTHAMRAASSGRPADMASLAIAQEAYETVAAEREQWLASGQVAIPIQPAPKRHDIGIAVDQGLAWRRVQEHPGRPGLLSRIRRRLGRH